MEGIKTCLVWATPPDKRWTTMRDGPGVARMLSDLFTDLDDYAAAGV